jgi:hypothetical protein
MSTGVHNPLTQKQFRQLVTDPHQIRAGIFAGAHEITNSFDLVTGTLTAVSHRAAAQCEVRR